MNNTLDEKKVQGAYRVAHSSIYVQVHAHTKVMAVDEY